MTQKSTVIVKNRSSNTVGYVIPEDNVRRIFASGEEKRILVEELNKLSYQPGGNYIIANYLQVKNHNLMEDLGIQVEPEYDMSSEDVKKLMIEGSLDSFLDCLDFAPTGVHQIIKDLAVKLPLNDVAKRNAIKEKLHFDVDRAIANVQAEKAAEEAEGKIAAPKKERRVAIQEPEPVAPKQVRRVAAQ